MRTKLLLVFLFLWFVSGAQPAKFEIGLTGSAFRLQISEIEGFYHVYTTDKPCFAGGIETMYHLNKRSSFSLGVNYMNIKYAVAYSWIFMQPNDPSIPRTGEFNSSYMEIPLNYRLNVLIKENFTAFLSGGYMVSFLMHSNNRTTYQDNSVRKTDYSEKFLNGALIGFGAQYFANENVSISVSAGARFFFGGFDAFMAQDPSDYGGKLGIYYRLK